MARPVQARRSTSRRDREDGRTQAALAWVRAGATHELTDPSEWLQKPGVATTRQTPGGGSVTSAGPVLIEDVTWKRLPRVKGCGWKSYDNEVADREARQPPEAAMRFLTGLPESY